MRANEVSSGSANDHEQSERSQSMALRKDLKGFGMPWEDQYGYVQTVKVGNTIYVSGQLSHDDQENMVGAAPLADSDKIRDHSNMETQMG
jgi:enamine deaminase RidA (YjgF/YER057c/UK114 family)